MSTKIDPTEQSTPISTARLLQQERQKLRRTNELLEKRVKAGTNALDRTNEQLEKEIGEHLKTEKKLQNRLEFDRILTTISTQFINLTTDEIDNNINLALEKIGRFANYDRSYIYLFDENGRALKNSHGWCHPACPVTLEDFRSLPANLFQNWMPHLIQQKTIHLQDIKDDVQESSSEIKLLKLQAVRSALIIPLIYDKETFGFFGLDSRQPYIAGRQEAGASLRVVSTIFVNALIRKKSEELLAKERNFAQQVMATMGQGVMTTTVEGVIDYINPAYAHSLSFEPEELTGKTALDFTHSEDHPKVIQAQMHNLEGQASSYEACLIKANGSPLYVLVNSVPQYDPQKRIIGSIATITDLTDRHATEAQIKTNAKEVNEIYQAAIQLFKPTGVKELAEQIAEITVHQLGFDTCGVLLLQEPVQLNTNRLGLHPIQSNNHLIWLAQNGRFFNNATDTIPIKGDGLVATAVRQGETIYVPDVNQDPRYLPENTYTQSELVIPLRAYNLIIGAIDLHSPQLNGFDERSRRIINVFAEHAGLALETVRLYDQLQEHAQALETQINERRKIEQALRTRSNELNATNAKLAKAVQAKDEFLANMSHELRTPLNAILGKSEILLEGIHGQLTEKQASSLQVIEKSGRHLLDLINDILDIAKIEAGKVTLDVQTVSLATLCESSLQFVRQMAHTKQIKLHAHIDSILTTYQGDERRLKQILINLLSNAVKFTPPEGEVGINILPDASRDAIQFQVWDTGIGIPTEAMKQLFKPFVQLDSSLSRSHEGTGLGLSLVYHLAELHGGSVSLESEVNVGSCFTVTLPQNLLIDSTSLQNQAKNDRKQYEMSHKMLDASGEEPLVLLVEDNKTNIETISEYLPVWGYQLTVANNGMEALVKAREEKPDLILMDIQIPEVDGLTAVRQLRQQKAFNQVPIIALTALAMDGDRERCLEAGANEYLSKPVQLRQLVALINKLLLASNKQEEPQIE